MCPFLIKKFHPFLNKNNPTIVLHMVLVIHFNFLNFGKHLSSQLGAFLLRHSISEQSEVVFNRIIWIQ